MPAIEPSIGVSKRRRRASSLSALVTLPTSQHTRPARGSPHGHPPLDVLCRALQVQLRHALGDQGEPATRHDLGSIDLEQGAVLPAERERARPGCSVLGQTFRTGRGLRASPDPGPAIVFARG
jgi:hypothetical protein